MTCLVTSLRCYSKSYGKWPSSTVKALKVWNTENSALFGPKLGKGKKKTQKSKRKKQENGILITAENLTVSDDFHFEEAGPYLEEDVPPPTEAEYRDTIFQHNPDTLSMISEDSHIEQYSNISSTDDLINSDTQLNRPEAYQNSNSNVKSGGFSTILNNETSVLDKQTVTSKLDAVLRFPLFSKTTVPFYSNLYSNFDSSTLVELSDTLKDGSVKFPSVSRILNETMPPESRYALEQWEKRIIEELGLEGFQKYKKETFANGHNLHNNVQELLSGKHEDELTILPASKGHWESMNCVFPEVGEVKFLETKVVHPSLCYLGIFDCLAEYKGNLCMIDWKTSKRKKTLLKYTYDNPLQLAAYIGALNFDTSMDLHVENAALVIAYEDGSPANVHTLTREQCVSYWGTWLQRLHEYWIKQLDKKSERTFSEQFSVQIT